MLGKNAQRDRSKGTLRAAVRACTIELLEDRRLLSTTDVLTSGTIAAPSAALLAAPSNQPQVNFTSPDPAAINVRRDTFISADVLIPNGGIDAHTMTSSAVYLTRDSDGARIGAVINTSGGGDVIVLRPTNTLDSNTTYTFHVTGVLKDVSGASFVPYAMSFTTGTKTGGSSTNIAFKQVANSNAQGYAFTSLAIGPDDHKMYAATFDGRIFRYSINSDGTLGKGTQLIQLTDSGKARTISGILFDPASTSSNPVLWVSSSSYGLTGAPDWAGKISVLSDDSSGNDLAKVKDRVVNLPRSARDHQTYQLAWGPDGALYFAQGSNSAMGAPDAAWGDRSEHLLNAAILRVDTKKLPSSKPLDVKTDSGGTYNPYASGAPLTIYATGVRSSYNIVWDSNGHLYAPTNGSASGGNTPGGGGVPGISPVTKSQNDYLFDVKKGGYYGQPNPVRHEYVLNGGNPTSHTDPAEVDQYPVGTKPDSNYRGFAFDFGDHMSPNGALEYTNGKAFGGALLGKLLITRYSGPDDIIALTVGSDGSITDDQTGITGLTNLNNPLDIVEDPKTGNLYVAEFGPEDGTDEPGGRKITLLRVSEAPAASSAFQSADIDATSAGSTTVVSAGKAYDVQAGGYNIGGARDGMRFTYEQITGDFDMKVQIMDLAGGAPIAKAGLMAREGTANDARNIFAAVSGSDGYRFSARAVEAGVTTISKGSTPEFPNAWVRLKRAGNVFTAYCSADGTNWTFMGRQTLVMPVTLNVGMAVSSGSTSNIAIGRFRALGTVAVGTTPTPTPTSTPSSTPTLGSWSNVAKAPVARGDAAVATVGSKMYVFGGFTDSTIVPKYGYVDVYDPAANSWKSKFATTPIPLAHAATAVDGNTIYVVGGITASGGKRVEAISNAWTFNVISKAWTPLPDLPQKRAEGQMVLVGRDLHYVGGQGTDPENARAEHYVLNLDNPAAWTIAAPLPEGRKRFGAVAANGKMYVIGGQTGETDRVLHKDVFVWDSANPGVWTKVASLPESRSHIHQAAVYDGVGNILIAGGKTNSDDAADDVLRYNIASNSWTALKSLPAHRSSGVLALINGQLVFSGGSSGNASFNSDTYRARYS